MDWIGHADLFVLASMLLYVIIVVSLGSYRLSLTRHQLRSFVRDAQSAFRCGAWDDVIATASRIRPSPVANVMASGLTAFVTAPPEQSKTEVIALTRRALQRAQATNRDYLSLGIVNLRSIAATAPFVGLLGTCLGILSALFSIGSGQKQAVIASLCFGLAASLITTALGLAAVIPAILAHNYLQLRRERIERELSNAALEIIDQLSVHPHFRSREESPSSAGDEGCPGLRTTADSRRRWKRVGELPAFALLAVPILVCGIVGFMAFQAKPQVGLGITLQPAVRPMHVPRVMVDRETNGRVVIFLNAKKVAPDELQSRLRNELNYRAGSTVCVQGDPALSFADIATVVDTVRGVADHVLLSKACP